MGAPDWGYRSISNKFQFLILVIVWNTCSYQNIADIIPYRSETCTAEWLIPIIKKIYREIGRGDLPEIKAMRGGSLIRLTLHFCVDPANDGFAMAGRVHHRSNGTVAGGSASPSFCVANNR